MEVLPIPIPGLLDLHASSPARSAAVAPGPPLVVSNQRWHHDKDVGAVLRALTRLADEQLADWGLTTRQWLLLAVLARGFPGVRPSLSAPSFFCGATSSTSDRSASA